MLSETEIDRIAICVGMLHGLDPKSIKTLITDYILKRASINKFIIPVFICEEDRQLFTECCNKNNLTIFAHPQEVDSYIEFITSLFAEVRKSRRRHSYRLRKLKNV